MSTERTNFTMIPRLVMESGLSVHAVRLYLEMRMTTGELKGGQCWKSTQTLAEGCRMAAGSVSKAKSELLSKGFIKNLGRIKGEKGNLRDTDTFLIVDIWSLNSEERSSDESERSLNERKRSYGETNKNPLNKNPNNNIHSVSGVVVEESDLIQMGYEPEQAEIISLWNEVMPSRGYFQVTKFSNEVEKCFELWNEETLEAENLTLRTAQALFTNPGQPNSKKPTFVRFIRDRYKSPAST